MQENTPLATFYDVAVRKFEFFDRCFDTLNTRAGVVLGFSSLAVTAWPAILNKLPVVLQPWVAWVEITVFVIMFGSGLWAYRVSSAASYPDLKAMRDWVTKEGKDPDEVMFDEIDKTIALQRQAVKTKANWLKVCLCFFALQMLIMVVGVAYPYVSKV